MCATLALDVYHSVLGMLIAVQSILAAALGIERRSIVALKMPATPRSRHQGG